MVHATIVVNGVTNNVIAMPLLEVLALDLVLAFLLLSAHSSHNLMSILRPSMHPP